MGKRMEKLVSQIFIKYIEFVYWTSRIKKTGKPELLKTNHEEKFVAGFWHGESYCFFPFVKGEELSVITTEDTRGNYITNICRHFGYDPIRVPDESTGRHFILKIRNEINGKRKMNVAISLDGPLGPYHEPKVFPLAMALFTKRKLLPVSIEIRRRIQLKHRWDQYSIPLPFNHIEIHVHDPIMVTKADIKENYSNFREQLRGLLEEQPLKDEVSTITYSQRNEG